MKTKLLLTLLLSAATAVATAQIPNSGFENWTNMGAYMEPAGWGSANSYSAGTFYPVTRSTDHYPASVGSYCISIQNNAALLPGAEAYGIVMSGTLAIPMPSFPISGHPVSLTGYYKFTQNAGDTAFIQAKLFCNGVDTSWATLLVKNTVSSWTPFVIPFNNYDCADSAHIILAAYFADGPNNVPHGNSLLKVDNLNFDVLITSVEEAQPESIAGIVCYPNPFRNEFTIHRSDESINRSAEAVITLTDMTNKEIVRQSTYRQETTLSTERIAAGIYFLRVDDGREMSVSKIVKTN